MANYELSWDYVEASERIVVNITKQHLLINSEFQFFGKVFKCYGNDTTPIAENEVPLSECTFSGYDTSVLTGRDLSDPQTVTVSWVNELGQTLSTTYELYILNNSRTKVLASDTNGLATIRIEGKGQSAFDLYVNGVKSNYTFASIVSADQCNDLTSSSTTKEKQDWFAKWIGYDISRNIELLTTNFTATNANPIINNTVDSSATRFAHYQTLDTTKIQSAPADDFVPWGFVWNFLGLNVQKLRISFDGFRGPSWNNLLSVVPTSPYADAGLVIEFTIMRVSVKY